MQVHLLYSDCDYDPAGTLSAQDQAVCEDLELEALAAAMAGDDEFQLAAIRPLFYRSLLQPEAIRYRQEILRDSLAHAAWVRELYALAVAGLENKAGRRYMIFGHSPEMLLEGAVRELNGLLPILASLHELAGEALPMMKAPGWQAFFSMLQTELSTKYLAEVQKLLQKLKFPQGILVRTHLGAELKAHSYVMCDRPAAPMQSWLWKLCSWFRPTAGFRITIAERDESGHRILSELRNAAMAQTAETVAACRDQVRSFFSALRTELAFYMGCLRLADRLAAQGIPFVFPVLENSRNFSCQGLMNITLALHQERRPAVNTIAAGKNPLVLITGANQGGKTTFFCSLGQACVMMACGMFVAAQVFRAGPGRVFTHFRREEDQQLQSGKFDEELQRMSGLIDSIHAGDLLLMNESFAATNEREGSEIALGILQALYESGVRVIFVTHFYTLTHALQQRGDSRILFLRADRQADGTRTFSLHPGEPLATAFGQDIYRRVFHLTEE